MQAIILSAEEEKGRNDFFMRFCIVQLYHFTIHSNITKLSLIRHDDNQYTKNLNQDK